jgi:branched-chain amino acid transport system substrate-binding protein
MHHDSTDPRDADRSPQEVAGKTVSRREFLKLAGVAGAGIALTGGLAGVVAACGESTTTTASEATTSTAGTTTTAGGATTTSAPATTATTSAEGGREIRVGFISPRTGNLAAFGVADGYCIDRWNEFVAGGLVCGDGKNHPIKIIVQDSQSDTNRAAQVAGDLILNDKVDVVTACSTPEVVNPIADQAEALGTPCLTCQAPMEPYFFGRGGAPDKPFKWTYHLFWGLTEYMATSLDLWTQLPTNKVIGAMWPNDTDGNAFRPAFTPFMQEKGFTVVDSGPFQSGTEDFTDIITKFKAAGVEIITGVVIPPDWTNFWNQSVQQGLKVKVVDIAKPTLFATTMEALGDIGYGLAGPAWFHPNFPFKSSLTGESAADMCLDFEERNQVQWQPPIMDYVNFEWVVDVLKRTPDVDDKEAFMKAVVETNMKDSIAGPFDFTAPVQMGTPHPVPNVVSTQLFGGQWVKGTTQNPWSIKVWPYDLKIVSTVAAPALTPQGKLEPLA